MRDYVLEDVIKHPGDRHLFKLCMFDATAAERDARNMWIETIGARDYLIEKYYDIFPEMIYHLRGKPDLRVVK
jgi:hypothetical protein